MILNESGNSLRGICDTIVSLALISILFLLLSLPVITIGLSLGAMYHTMRDVFLKKEGSPLGCFLKAVKSLWRTALPFGAAIAVFTGVLIVVKSIAAAFMEKPFWLMRIYDSLALLGVLCLLWGAALMSRLSVSPTKLFLIALTLVGKHLFTTFTTLICVLLTYLIARMMPPLLILLPACCCYLLLHLLEPRVDALVEDYANDSSGSD